MKSLALLFIMLISFANLAKGQPLTSPSRDYDCNQKVYIRHLNAGLFGYVSQVCDHFQQGNLLLGQFVLGYKNTGRLAVNNPDKILATVTLGCRAHNGAVYPHSVNVTLGREWHGTGYMSSPLTFHKLGCGSAIDDIVKITFKSPGNQAENDQFVNYTVGTGFYNVFVTNELVGKNWEDRKYAVPSGIIGLEAWDHIISEMRKCF